MSLSRPPLPQSSWRAFQTLTSNSEAVAVAACCNFSLGTLEVSCREPGLAGFALTEQQRPGTWRWAVFNLKGLILNAGCESTQQQAKSVAARALQLSAG